MTQSPQFETKADKHAFWQQHVDAHIESKLTQSEYCKAHNLSASLFWSWRKKLRPDAIATAPQTKTTSFIPVQMPVTNSHAQAIPDINCKLPNGIEMSWSTQVDSQYISSVVGALL